MKSRFNIYRKIRDATDQYVQNNATPTVQSEVSSVPNDDVIKLINDMHEQAAACHALNEQHRAVNESLIAELARYKKEVNVYEKRARFELTKKEQKIEEEICILIFNRNKKEASLKKELQDLQKQLNSTVGHNKSMAEEVEFMKTDFKQKEDKYLDDFLNLKKLKEKIEDRLYKQDQSIQTPTLYDGYAMVKTGHTPALVSNSEETLDLAEKSRQKMLKKVKEGNQSEPKAKLNFGPPDYLKTNYLAKFVPQKQLTPEQLYWSKDMADIAKEKALEQSGQRPKTALMVYPPNTPTKLVPKFISTKSLTEGERGFEQTKECYLTEIILFFKTIKQHFKEIHINLIKEIKEIKDVFEQMEKEVEQNDVDMRCAEIERKNLLIENENLIVACISTDVLSCVMSDVYTISQFSKLNDAFIVEQARVVQLEAEISKLKHKIEKDDHNEMIKSFSKLEIDHLDLQLEYNNIKNERYRAENVKIKKHYLELYNSIKITRAQTIEKTNSLVAEIEKGKAELKGKMQSTIEDDVKPRVLTPRKHLKDNVEILREIGEEGIIANPLDSALQYACRYTKRSLEIIESVFATCPLDAQKRDKKIATTSVTRKKQVTFVDQCETSDKHTVKHVKKHKVQQTNVPIPSIGVRSCIKANGSKPRGNTRKDRILPTKKQVEEHSRNNKSSVKQKNRIGSSISYKHIVINSNSLSVCKTCNKCFVSDIHDKCVESYLKSVKSPTVKKVLSKYKNVWKATGTLFAQVGYKWLPNGRKFTIVEKCPLTRITKPTVVPAQTKPKNVSTSTIVINERFKNTYTQPLTSYKRRTKQVKSIPNWVPAKAKTQTTHVPQEQHIVSANQQDPNIHWGSNIPNSPSLHDKILTICLLSKASKNKSWLWHRRLNHLNFGTINELARKNLVRGLPRLKYEKDHLCSACQLGKRKKHNHPSKSENTNLEVLYTLHMDLCGPIRVLSINGKKYILVIIDDYSRFTWIKFLRTKDETPEIVIKFLTQIQTGLNKTVRFIRTDNGTEFVNQVLTAHYEKVGITHERTIPRSPQQNGVVKRWNRKLVEAAWTMLIFSRSPMFL
ncbi:retrovirus-related pol polyprotein from transposon TNT 1-94 [Tanacetum coccineum]